MQDLLTAPPALIVLAYMLAGERTQEGNDMAKKRKQKPKGY